MDDLAAALHFGDLGILRKRQGRYSDSEKAYRRALDILARHGETSDRRFAVNKQNLALVLKDQGQYAEAEKLLREVVELFKVISGEDSADFAYPLNNLGHVILEFDPQASRLNQAGECFARAHEIRRRRLGENHPETLRSQYSLGMIYEKQGDYAEAERIQREVLDRRRAIHEVDHIDVLHSMNYVARALQRQDRLDEAAQIYREILQRGQSRFGVEHPNVKWFRKNYLSLLQRQKDDDETRTFYADYLQALETAASSSSADPRILQSYAHLLLTCEIEALRDPNAALLAARRAMEAGGSNDPNVVETFSLALERNGDFAQAANCLSVAIPGLASDSANRRQQWENRIKHLQVLTGQSVSDDPEAKQQTQETTAPQ
jgi:tetratricopeptide (TPR) repeat protein